MGLGERIEERGKWEKEKDNIRKVEKKKKRERK